jgi:hypothetical protein
MARATVSANGKLVAAAFAIVATVFAAWWFDADGAGGPVASSPPRTPVAESFEGGEAAPVAAATAVSREESVLDYDRQFAQATDLATFAATMQGLAREGDDAAQFWLYRALTECGDRADEVGAPLSPRCERLRGLDGASFGEPAALLRDSARSGYPLAQATLANRLMLDHSPTTPGADPVRDQARDLMLKALRSRDPEVILMTGGNARLLVRTESARERHEWVWEVAACARGADCGPFAAWVRSMCAQDERCQPHETGIDLIRRRVGAQMPEIEEAAQTLNSHIDAGEWDELGF